MISMSEPSNALCEPEIKRQVSNRLRRARGQLDAIIEAVEGEGHCRDVVTQIAAVSSAVKRAGFVVVAHNMKRCLKPEGQEGESAEELEKLFMMLS